MGPFPRFAALISILAVIGVAHADSTRMPRKDTSLPLKEYLDKGMPAPDKEWDISEFEKAASVLTALDPAQYPRSGSLKSSMLFARFTSTAGLKEAAADPVARMKRMTELWSGFFGLNRLYLGADKQKSANYEREIAAFAKAQLSVSRSIAEVIPQVKATVKSQEDSKAFVQLEQMSENGVSNDVAFCVTLLNSDFDPAVRRGVFDALKQDLPAAIKSLDSAHRDKVLAYLQGAVNFEGEDISLRGEMAAFINSLAK